MNNFNGEIASESVSRGHPDKLADQISDAVLDACIKLDSKAKVACETFLKDNHIILGGEIGSADINIGEFDFESVVREVLNDVGYSADIFGSDKEAIKYAGVSDKNFDLLQLLGKQSSDIHQGVVREDKSIGAGDQGFVYGYACDDTPDLMPAPIYYCQLMMRKYHEVMIQGKSAGQMRPDAKCQLSFRYVDGLPKEITNITVSAQHAPMSGPDLEQFRMNIVRNIIKPVIPEHFIGKELQSALNNLSLNERLFINPTGKFERGGPKGDAGLTGRKIIVDTYGGLAHHGGGAFSGKDPTKVDRSAAYMARHVAKNLVKAELCARCEVMIGYAIGIDKPLAVHINTMGTQSTSINQQALEKLVQEHFPFKPEGIIEGLNLCQPIYSSTARYGHFGQNDPRHTWENTNIANSLGA